MSPLSLVAVSMLWCALAALPRPAAADGIDFQASPELIALDRAIDWRQAKLMAVQHENRYKTFDSFARELLTQMTGSEHFPGLSPEASAFEWMFRGAAYADSKVIYIKDKGIRLNITAHMPQPRADEIRRSGFITPTELHDPDVMQRFQEMSTITRMAPAMSRAALARGAALGMEQQFHIVPSPEGGPTDAWYMPLALFSNLSADGKQVILGGFPQLAALEGQPPVDGVSPNDAVTAIGYWMVLSAAWQKRDAAAAQTALNGLVEALPRMAPAIYPSHSQRAAEQVYYSWGKFWMGWLAYFLAILVSIWAAVTRWKTPWVLGMIILIAGLLLHAFGIGLRWYILDRIPVANMFEAVTFAAWVGVALCLVLEIFFRRGLFLLGGSALGFTFLILATYVVPGGGTLSSIRVILDDVMLRIHTTMIISSYGLIFIASVIALVYLFGYYLHRNAARAAEAGVMIAFAGGAMWLISIMAFTLSPAAGTVDGFEKSPGAAAAFGLTAVLATLATFVLLRLKAAPTALVCAIALAVTSTLVAVGDHDLVYYGGIAITAIGVVWFVGNSIAVLCGAAPQAQVVLPGVGKLNTRELRPILAGGAPGDEGRRSTLPQWLVDVDWMHLIILNIVFVLLFVGIILGAVWADYSWGRPWGWDPKEVFAMNTWLIYAILIHARFATRARGLTTAWLSIIGCLMMAFNWVFVNFYIVGLHSYA